MDSSNNFDKNTFKNIFGDKNKQVTEETNSTKQPQQNKKNEKNTEEKISKPSKDKEIENKSTPISNINNKESKKEKPREAKDDKNKEKNNDNKNSNSNTGNQKSKEAVMTGLFGDYNNISKTKKKTTDNSNKNSLNENTMANIFGNINNLNLNKKKSNNNISPSSENQIVSNNNSNTQNPQSNSNITSSQNTNNGNQQNVNNINLNLKSKTSQNFNKNNNVSTDKNELGKVYKVGDLYSDTNLIRKKLGIMNSEEIKDIAKATLNVPDKKYLGVLVLTDFRLIFQIENENNLTYNYSEDYFKIPLFNISKVEKVQDKKMAYDAIPMEITLKDTRVIKFHLYDLQRFFYNLSERTNPDDCKQFFDFAKKYNKIHYQDKNVTNGWNFYDPIIEFSRQGITEDNVLGLRYCYVNKDFKMCATYPEFLIEPSNITDEQLKQSSKYRTKGRLPIFTYYYGGNINNDLKVTPSIWRSAQNKRGLMGSKTCDADISLLNSISRFGGEQGKLYIYDCRPKLNAFVNRVGGGGYEKEGDYDNATLYFCEIDNIHKARKALKEVYSLCLSNKINDYNNFWTNLEQTDWYQFIYLMLKNANEISKTLQANHSVLIHCSDGWDRTAQLSSLSQLLLDPFYRTAIGFAVLIEKDWLSFGHQFGLRNGFSDKEKQDQASPIFLQFLDAVHQLLEQFPNAFEFNEKFLLFLAKNYSINLYGTFLYNNEKERKEQDAKNKTASVWTEIFMDLKPYLNIYYDPNSVKILEPNYSYYNLKLWTSFFMENNIYLENKHFYVNDYDKSISFKTKQEFYAYKKKEDEIKYSNYQTKYDELLKVMAETYFLIKDNKDILDNYSKDSLSLINELKPEMDKINKKRIMNKEIIDKNNDKKEEIKSEVREEIKIEKKEMKEENKVDNKEEKKDEKKELKDEKKDIKEDKTEEKKDEKDELKEEKEKENEISQDIDDEKAEEKIEEKKEETTKEDNKEEGINIEETNKMQDES